jgi:uncharacterized short protein YbdD (DUF466 family)
MSTKADLNKALKVIHKVIPAMRENMTSITRYVRDTKDKHPNKTMGQWIDYHEECKKLALEAVSNILVLLNTNPELHEVERMKETPEADKLSMDELAILDALVTMVLNQD